MTRIDGLGPGRWQQCYNIERIKVLSYCITAESRVTIDTSKYKLKLFAWNIKINYIIFWTVWLLE
jgi:hypothetical protein